MESSIVIRHLSGSKQSSVDRFPLAGLQEIVAGRDSSCQLQYDKDRDDLVSRRHMKIVIAAGNPPEFTVVDLGSRNGTFVNGKRVQAAVALKPGDAVRVGAGGPEFRFDLEPAVAAAPVAAAPKDAATRGEAVAKPAPAENRPAGERTAPRPRRRRAVVVAIAAGVVTVGAVSLLLIRFPPADWHWPQGLRVAAQAGQARLHQAAVAGGAAAVSAGDFVRGTPLYIRSLKEKYFPQPLTAAEIARTNGASVIGVESRWELVEPSEGQGLRQVYLPNEAVESATPAPLVPGAGRELPVFVLARGNRLLPILTTAENPDYRPIGGTGRGTGFFVTSDGTILTEGSVAAPWTRTYNWPAEDSAGVVARLDANSQIVQTAVISRRQFPQWKAGDPAFVLDAPPLANSAKLRGREMKAAGRNDALTVSFGKSAIPAKLSRIGGEAELAVLHVDPPRAIRQAPLREGDPCKPGERVVVLGGAGEAARTLQIAKLRSGVGEANFRHASDGLYELSPDRAAAVLPGAPLFDERGRVVAVETAGSGESASLAIPIRYGLELIRAGAEAAGADRSFSGR